MFQEYVALLVIDVSQTKEGEFCKSCISKHFWEMTTKTATLGWWGIFSFVITPLIILNNCYKYLCCIRMPSVPGNAIYPTLTEADVEQINPHSTYLFNLLNDGEDFKDVVNVIANRANVTPGQVVLYIRAVAQTQQQS